MKERIHWIDISKGIATILVVLGHVVSSYHQAGLYQDNQLFNFSNQFVYSFHMALFTILSGYLFSKRKKTGTKRQQVLQKLINYGIPYVIFSVVWVVMKTVMSEHTNRTVTFRDLALIPVYPISFMWFIYALMIMQIFQVLITFDSKLAKKVHLLVAGGGYFIQPYLANSLSGIRFSDCVLNDLLKNYIFFVIGVYLAEHVIVKLDKQRNAGITISGILLMIGNILKYKGLFSSAGIIPFILSLAGALFVVELSIAIKQSRCIEYLGRQSLPIYVLQGIAIAASRLLLTALHLNVTYGILPLIICTVMGCTLPLCVYWVSTMIWKMDGCFYPGKYIKA